jgi:hypothetical protein
VIGWRRATLAASGWLLLLACVVLPPRTPLREGGAFVFMLFGPGAAVARHWPGPDRLERLVVILVVSVSLTVLAAEGLALAGAWSQSLALAVLAAITSLAALAPSTAAPSRQAPRPASGRSAR